MFKFKLPGRPPQLIKMSYGAKYLVQVFKLPGRPPQLIKMSYDAKYLVQVFK